MVNFSLTLVVRVLAASTAITMAYMPSLFVRRIYRDKCVGNASIAPLIVLQGISHGWTLYGFMTETWFPSFPCFLIGDVAAMCYNFVYWRYSTDRRRIAFILTVMYLIMTMPTIYVIIGGLGYTNETRAEVAKNQGIICDAVMIGLNFVMLKNLIDVYKKRSAAALNTRVLLVGSANACCWLAFGVVTSNWIVIIPNIFVMVLHGTAWILYAAFRPRSHLAVAIRDASDTCVAMSIDLSPTTNLSIDPSVKRESTTSGLGYNNLFSPIEPSHYPQYNNKT